MEAEEVRKGDGSVIPALAGRMEEEEARKQKATEIEHQVAGFQGAMVPHLRRTDSLATPANRSLPGSVPKAIVKAYISTTTTPVGVNQGRAAADRATSTTTPVAKAAPPKAGVTTTWQADQAARPMQQSRVHETTNLEPHSASPTYPPQQQQQCVCGCVRACVCWVNWSRRPCL